MGCVFCKNNDNGLIYQTKMWKVHLSDPQGYIAQCIIILKRHCDQPDHLTDMEWMDLRHVMNKTSDAIRKVFNATHFNESCLMNNFYKNGSPDPHVHYHLRPRYKHSIHINDKIFTDNEFAHHYNNHSSNNLSEEDVKYIHDMLYKELNKDPFHIDIFKKEE